MLKPDIASVSDPYKGILLDAYGVFWNGNDCGLLPGAKESMEKMVASGKVVGILSNSTQQAAKEIDKVSRHGVIQGKHYHFFVTSGEVAKSIFSKREVPFATPRNKFWLFGGVHPRFSSHAAIFETSVYREAADLNDADFIYLSIPHIEGKDQTDPEVFREALQSLAAKKLPMVCPNPDRFAHEGNPPRAVVRQGSLAKLYEEMGGQVFYIGKPSPNAYAMAMGHFQRLGLTDPKEILMVGDTPETDIRGARSFGMASALLTKTGIMAERSCHTLSPQETPDHWVERL